MKIRHKSTSHFQPFLRSKIANPPRPYDEVYAKGFLGEHPVNDWIRGVHYIGIGEIYDPTSKRVCKTSHIVRLEDYSEASDPNKLCGTIFDFGNKIAK